MSHSMLLRNRIKTVTSIHRTTSAMRLIAMSVQGRLRKHEVILQQYSTHAHALYQEMQQVVAQRSVATDQAQSSQPPLLLLIGSHKGLCGSFNDHLFHHLELHHPNAREYDCIVVGPYAKEYAIQNNMNIIMKIHACSVANYTSVSHAITQQIARYHGRTIYIISQTSRNFFVRIPQTVTAQIPLPAPENLDQMNTILYETAATIHMRAYVTRALHGSLLAEQAARFLSMDNATRNAEELLHTMKLEYNKIRQATVTRELIELTSGLGAGSVS